MISGNLVRGGVYGSRPSPGLSVADLVEGWSRLRVQGGHPETRSMAETVPGWGFGPVVIWVRSWTGFVCLLT
jgi:hypothetical protein